MTNCFTILTALFIRDRRCGTIIESFEEPLHSLGSVDVSSLTMKSYYRWDGANCAPDSRNISVV